MRLNHIRTLATSAAAFIATASFAGEYRFSLTSNSSLNFTAGVAAPLAGTLIGNWSPTTNPTGTRTLAGIFGGNSTTNTAIPYTAELAAGTNEVKVPTGGFSVRTPTDGSNATLRGLNFDLLGGSAADLGLTVDLVFSTFRTKSPDSYYFGSEAIPPIPLASGAINTLRVTQVGEAEVTTLQTPTGISFAGTVNVEFAVQASLLGQEIVNITLPGVLPVAGTIDTKSGDPTGSISFKNGVSVPLPTIPAFENQAVALPTILPPGNTANLLFTGTIDGPSGAFTLGINAMLEVSGAPVSVDINGDGVVNGIDLGRLLVAWGTANAAADLDRSGSVNGQDLAMLMSCWHSSPQ